MATSRALRYIVHRLADGWSGECVSLSALSESWWVGLYFGASQHRFGFAQEKARRKVGQHFGGVCYRLLVLLRSRPRILSTPIWSLSGPH